jgi:hypothetical protein
MSGDQAQARRTPDGLADNGDAMDKVDPMTEGAPAPSTARPSLFGDNAPTRVLPSNQPEAVSILSSLDKGGIKRPSQRRTLPARPIIVVAFLAVVTVAIVIGMDLPGNGGIFSANEPSSGLAKSASGNLSPPAAPTPTPEQAVTEAATIETTASLPTVADDAVAAEAVADDAEGQPASTTEPAGSQPLAALMTDLGGPGTPAPGDASTDNAHKVASSAPSPRGTARASVRSSRRASAKRTAGKAKTEQQAAKAEPMDRDASLLAALAAYGEGRPAKDINKEVAPIAKPVSKTPAKAGKGEFDPTQGVVTREPRLSTGELVRRCKTLGFFEGLLCRMRVCSNLWGKDPACPRGAAPSAATTTP